MKIHVSSGEQRIRLWIPTVLAFGPVSAWIVETLGRKYAPEAMGKIPEGTVSVLCRELRHLKRKYGRLDLVEAETPDGSQYVKITL